MLQEFFIALLNSQKKRLMIITLQLLSRTKPVSNNKGQALVNLSEITKIQKLASAPQELPSVIKFIENR